MVVQAAKLDDGLLRALQEGAAALPQDLNRLRDYLGTVQDLLAEKANEFEPSWDMAQANLAETETLLVLEEMILDRAAHVPGPCRPCQRLGGRRRQRGPLLRRRLSKRRPELDDRRPL